MATPLPILAVVASILAGCAADDPTERYVGTWSYHRSTVSTYCDDQPDVTRDLVGDIVVTRAGDAQLAVDTGSQYTLAFAISESCAPKFSASESEAVLVPQGPCLLETASGTMLTLTYQDFRLVPANLSGPGIEPMTPALSVKLDAELWSTNGRCIVTSDATVITTEHEQRLVAQALP